MAAFFIDRPIFAWVIALIVMLSGALALSNLPVQQYPNIAPPAVTITANYPGASAKTLENSVTQVIEQSMTGLDNFLYMSSKSSSAGTVEITISFVAGTDSDIAQVQVQNKLAQAEPLLPLEVQQQGVTVTKSSRSFLMVIGLISPDSSQPTTALSDYMSGQFKEQLSRIDGVGNIVNFGSKYAMRIWLQPEKLATYSLTPVDVRNAILSQNTQLSVGQLGGLPAIDFQQLNATIISQERLENVEEFEQILLKVQADGSVIYLKDVARIELGQEQYSTVSRYNEVPAAALAVQLASGANALATATAIRERINEIAPTMPAGMEVIYPYDTTPFVKISISEVTHTLFEAIGLVFFVIFLFLGNFRATLIPIIAIPVVLLGTFGIMSVFGYSINTLTMFGLVLAIGLLVDDAIVVVENVERVMEEEGLPPKEATKKSMKQITGALIGIALLLSAVVVPMAFMAGATGAIYRQFSLTIVSAMALSVFVAFILSPALCATLLKPSDHLQKKGLLGLFNRLFEQFTNWYQSTVAISVQRPIRLMLIYLSLILVLVWSFMKLPSSFLPEEDQGLFLTLVQLPVGATQQRTNLVIEEIEDYVLQQDNVESIFSVSGFSFAGQGQNMGMAFVKLTDWSERTSMADSVNAIIGKAWGVFSQIQDAIIFPINIPPIQELGTASGFDFMLQDRAGIGHQGLIAARNQLLQMANTDPRFAGVRPNGMDDQPIFRIEIDYEKLKVLRLDIAEVNATLSIAWGGAYVNDFVHNGQIKKVYIQADAPYRMIPNDINKWYVNNNLGEMVPFTAFTSTYWEFGSPRLERYNGLPAVNIQGQAAPGYSTGDVMLAIEEMAEQLPQGIGIEWTGISYQERVSGDQAPFLYAISLLVVFLCLAALYESWAVPFAVMMVIPLGILGAVLAVTARELSNDVYFQVGLLTTIGLSAKNAILIVEFAKSRYEQGESLVNAVLEASRMRLRPIVMTSMAFILGVLPLAMSTGAGALSRQAIGTGVIGGMLSATFLAILFVPLFYILVIRFSLFIKKPKPKPN